MSEKKKESAEKEEKPLEFILDLEEQFACLVQCLEEETKKKLTLLLKKKNKEKHALWEQWKKDHAGERYANQQKLDTLGGNFKWITPIAIIMCTVLSFFLWTISVPAALMVVAIGVMSVIALFLSIFAPIEAVQPQLPSTLDSDKSDKKKN